MNNLSIYNPLKVPKLVFGLSGYPESGKDTLFKIISTSSSIYTREKFAYGIQDIVAVMCNIYKPNLSHRERFEDREWKEGKNLTIAGQLYSPRELLQKVGTECFRDTLSKDIWVSSLYSRLTYQTNYEIVLITDVRFENERDFLGHINGISLFVDRPESEKIAKTDSRFKHASESYIDTLKSRADIVIPNYGDKAKFLDLCYDITKRLNNVEKTFTSISSVEMILLRNQLIAELKDTCYKYR